MSQILKVPLPVSSINKKESMSVNQDNNLIAVPLRWLRYIESEYYEKIFGIPIAVFRNIAPRGDYLTIEMIPHGGVYTDKERDVAGLKIHNRHIQIDYTGYAVFERTDRKYLDPVLEKILPVFRLADKKPEA